jgi:hypothetical protein
MGTPTRWPIAAGANPDRKSKIATGRGNAPPRRLDRSDEHELLRGDLEVECLPATPPFCCPSASSHQTVAQHRRI